MQDIKEFAVNQGFGYKTANLKALQESKILVPAFIGIASNTILEVLKQNTDILTSWKNIQEKIKTNNYSLEEKSATLPQTSIKQDLQDLRSKIHNAIIGSKDITPSDFLKNEEGHVIIRSTGMEDSDELSNAGGNESIPYINPKNEADVLNAISLVCQSYFSEKSIQQRLNAGDKTVCDTNKDPFVPILIQKMIESPVKDKANITFSGVAVIGSQNFGEYVNKINIGLGNNAGVVNSIVPTDEILITPNRKDPSFPNISKYVTTKNVMYNTKNGERKLQILPVPNELQQYTMPNHVVIKLNNELEKIRKLYNNKPLDIEFTININKGETKINILQVRPLVENKHKNKRTFVSPTDSNNLKSVPFKLIAGNKEAVILNPKNIIFANSIAEGLNTSYNKQDIDCVVIKTRPSTLSHEAIVFNTRGIPVVYLEDDKYFELKDMVSRAKNNNSVILDQQLERFIETNKSKNDALKLIKDGNYSYPIVRGFSKQNKINKEEIQDFSQFLQKTEIDMNLIEQFKKNPTQTLKGVISNFKEASILKEFEKQTESILQLLKYSADLTLKADPQNNLLKAEKIQLIKIYNEAKKLTDLIKNMAISENERLLYIQNLSSLMLNMQTGEGVNSDSLLNILSKVALIKRQQKQEEKMNPTKTELNAIGKIVACTDNINNHWENLIKNEEDDSKILQNVIQMQKSGILSEYINIYLSSCDKINSIESDNSTLVQIDFQAKIKDFESKINGFASSEYKLLQDELVKLSQDFLNCETTPGKNMSQFLFATNASKLLDVWDKSIKKFRENPSCDEINYHTFVQKLSSSFVAKFIERVDEIRKSNEKFLNDSNDSMLYKAFYNSFASDDYIWTAEGKEKYFHLEHFDNIRYEIEAKLKTRSSGTLQKLIENYDKSAKDDISKQTLINEFLDYVNQYHHLPYIASDYFKNVKENSPRLIGINPSENFNVQNILPSIALNATNAKRSGSFPKTTEDLFTFLHQLSLEGVSCIMKNYTSLENIVPKELTDFLKLKTDKINYFFDKCTNVDIKNGNIELTFIHTLGCHSASTKISFDKKKKRWGVSFSISGEGGAQVHEYIGVLMALEMFAKEHGIKIKNSKAYSADFAKFEMEFEDINKFATILPKICDICDCYKDFNTSYGVTQMQPAYLEYLKNNQQDVKIEDLINIYVKDNNINIETILKSDKLDGHRELKLKLAITWLYIKIKKETRSNDLSSLKSEGCNRYKFAVDIIKEIQHEKKNEWLSCIDEVIENVKIENTKNGSDAEFKSFYKEQFKDIIPQKESIKEPDSLINSTPQSKLEFKKLENEEYVITVNKRQIARTKETNKNKIMEHIDRAIELTAKDLKIEKKEVEYFLDKLNDHYINRLNAGNLSTGKTEGYQSLNITNELKTDKNAKISALLQKHNKFNTAEKMNYQGKEVGIRSYRLALLRNAIKEKNSDNTKYIAG